jgi:type IV secretion system protein TrbL
MFLFLFFQGNFFSGPGDLTTLYQNLVPRWVSTVQPYALDLFGALAGLDLAFFGWSLWRTYRGDVTAAIMSTANRLLLIGLFLDLLLKGPEWAQDIVDMFRTVGQAVNGGQALSPGSIFVEGFTIAGQLLFTALKASLLNDLLTGLALGFGAVVIVVSFTIISVEFIVTQVQTFLAVGLGLFFLAFGGSTWTRTYVERYFSYAVAAGTRLMTLYFLVAVGLAASVSWEGLAAAAPLQLNGVLTSWGIAVAAVVFCVICWRGSSIAAGILAGGPNLSHNEIWGAMSAAVSAGVTAAFIASGVGSAVGAAGAAAGVASASGGGAAMTAGGAAPTAAGASSASVGVGQTAAAAGSHASSALVTASSHGGHSNGSAPRGDFGGLDS